VPVRAPQDRLGDAAPGHDRSRWRICAEALLLAVSPAAAFFGLRLTLMAPPDLNDPAMHTTFIIDPHDIFFRYAAVFQPTERLREGARVGFLVPGRIAYLLFGGLPGFVVFRYVLALIAVVPAYLLLRRLYNRVAGVVAVIVILSCPVIILAWGTDFPDSAGVSYLIGGLACLAMPSQRHRIGWLIGAAVLFTLAVWALASSAPLVIATVLAYWLVRRKRDRQKLVRDLSVMVIAALAVTGLLMIASAALIGPWDYILTTIQSLIYLAEPAQTIVNHSRSPLWAPYITYLLVPPAVGLACYAAFGGRLKDFLARDRFARVGRRLSSIPTAQLIISVACAFQIVIYAVLQFIGSTQVLEVHYFSSLLWGSVVLTLAITIAELGAPILEHARYRWLVPVVLVAVPLAFEITPSVPQFGWMPVGLLIVVAIVLLAWVARREAAAHDIVRSRFMVGGALTAIVAGLLVLTVTPTQHKHERGTVVDTFPDYAYTLGGNDPAWGNDSTWVGLYADTTGMETFVGPAAYSGEQLLMWWNVEQLKELREPIGIFHAFFDSMPSELGNLTPLDKVFFEQRHPAQILLMSLNGQGFAAALTSLQSYQPVLVHAGVLQSGSVALHLWLIDLKAFLQNP
jgi:4-amino-4-deoxy-L-arabinose transferase-like glycosyltransferase